MTISIALTDQQIDACFPVMYELRPHLDRASFVETVRELQRDGFILAYLEDAGTVVSVAGYRFKRTLAADRFLYVDDLVTRADARSKSYGRALLEWLKDRSREDGCAKLQLDSNMQRQGAHRFYQANDLPITGYHFGVVL